MDWQRQIQGRWEIDRDRHGGKEIGEKGKRHDESRTDCT